MASSNDGPTHRLAYVTPDGGIGYQDVTRNADIATPMDADEAGEILAESLDRPGLHVIGWSRYAD